MKMLVAVVALLVTMVSVSFAHASGDAAPVAGSWQGSFVTPGPSGEMTLELAYSAGAWTGRLTLRAQDGTQLESDVRNAKIEGDGVAFEATLMGSATSFAGKLAGDKLTGTLEVRDGDRAIPGRWEVARGAR